MFNMYEGGRVSMDVYLDTILFYQDRPFSKEAFRAYMFEQSKPLEEMLEGMLAWKESYPHLRIFSLNNEPKELHAYRVNHFQLRRLYDGFVASCDVGLRKPDPAIYALAAGIAGVQPSECLYIDDRDVLAAAGRKAGLQARTHHTATETLQFLQGL
jgi:putative hydrolase of the HAD superfamily